MMAQNTIYSVLKRFIFDIHQARVQAKFGGFPVGRKVFFLPPTSVIRERFVPLLRLDGSTQQQYPIPVR